jgi:outer membrane protein TolC
LKKVSEKSGRQIIFLLTMVFWAATSDAQPFTLQHAESRARKGYPLMKQKGLLEKTAALTVSNLAKGYVPQMALGGQASYQSDVTKVSIPVSSFFVEPPSKDQYRLSMDLSQLIYDGGMIRKQQVLAQQQSTLESSRLDLELYKLQERVDQLYCSILFVDAQLAQLKLVKTDIQTGINKVSSQLENGVAFKSALNTLKAEALRIDQRGIEFNSMRRGLIEVMGVLTDTVLTENVQFEIPELKEFQAEGAIQKQLNLFKAQQDLNNHQLNLLRSKSLPKATAFLQAGYGRPGLNMLKNEFQWFSIGGLRLNWSISNLYTTKNEKELNAVAASNIAVQQETYLKNASAQVRQQLEEVEKFRQLIETDREIIALRNAVKEAAAAQLEAGVITASDYIREVNAADQASQALKAHELQWLQANIRLEIIRGKK